jgi:hypothetical protein
VRAAMVGVLSFFFFIAVAAAQVPTGGNVFVGYSYTSANLESSQRTGLSGWNGSLEGRVFPFVGMVADISAQYGTQENIVPTGYCTGVIGQPCPGSSLNTTFRNYLFGPRVSVSVGRFRPFAEALFGASHISQTVGAFSASDTSFSNALGGGLDYRLFMLLGWRVEADMLQTRFYGNTQNNVRVSTGLVLTF